MPRWMRLPPLDGCVAVCLVLTIEVYGHDLLLHRRGFFISRMTVMQSMKLGIDVNRHKEIIVKAVSAILLLLLKHFKVRHKQSLRLLYNQVQSFEILTYY